MESFPTLSVKPNVNFGHKTLYDPVYRSDSSEGVLLVHSRTTHTPICYNLKYTMMPDGDKELLENFEENTIGYGGLRFLWLNPQNGKLYVALLVSPIDYKLNERSRGNLWDVSFSIAAIREEI